MDSESCRTCNFFRRDQTISAEDLKKNADIGICYLEPPRVQFVMYPVAGKASIIKGQPAQEQGIAYVPHSARPVVREGDVCRHWARR